MGLECLLLSLNLQVLQGRRAASNSTRAQGRQGFGGHRGAPSPSVPHTAAAYSCCTGQINHQQWAPGAFVEKHGFKQYWEDLVSHLTVQPALKQPDEGIVGDVECFRGQSVRGGTTQGSKSLGGKHMLWTWLCTAPLPPSPLLTWQFVTHGAWELCMLHPRNVTHCW